MTTPTVHLVYIDSMERLLLLFGSMLLAISAFGANGPCVVEDRSHFEIHVGTAGLFGAFAHDHLIEAQKIAGCATLDSNDITHSSVRLTFAAAGLRVVDPKASAKDRTEVQKTMETSVLQISQYPEVIFESTGIERGGGPNQFRVRGNLTIRGKTQPVLIPLTLMHTGAGVYQAAGKYSFKQTSFGIKPIQLGGGTIRVKDELQTEFQIFLK